MLKTNLVNNELFLKNIYMYTFIYPGGNDPYWSSKEPNVRPFAALVVFELDPAILPFCPLVANEGAEVDKLVECDDNAKESSPTVKPSTGLALWFDVDDETERFRVWLVEVAPIFPCTPGWLAGVFTFVVKLMMSLPCTTSFAFDFFKSLVNISLKKLKKDEY